MQLAFGGAEQLFQLNGSDQEDRVMARMPYPSDLTDEQWKVIEDLIPPAKAGRASARGFDA